jgi:RNA-splicing ligase RtcB
LKADDLRLETADVALEMDPGSDSDQDSIESDKRLVESEVEVGEDAVTDKGNAELGGFGGGGDGVC